MDCVSRPRGLHSLFFEIVFFFILTNYNRQAWSGIVKAIANDAHGLCDGQDVSISIETTKQKVLIHDLDTGVCFAGFFIFFFLMD